MALEIFETTILCSSMAKRRREPNSDDDTAEYNTVFMDTSLDTHFAMLVSKSDTVSDFKKRMVCEHILCFPKIGKISIQSLKVKRRAHFYHLPDTMLVWSVFHGVKKSWFVSADLTLKEEAKISSGSKKNTKRKRFKKSANTNLENSGIEQTDNVVVGSHSGLPCPSTAHIPEESNKEERILYRKGDEINFNTSTPEAGEKVQCTNGNEVQSLEDVATGKTKTDEKAQNSPGVENKDQILEFNLQVDKDSENMDKKVGIEALTTEDNSVSFVNSNTEEGIHVASSQVLSRKLEAMHEVAVNTVHLARVSENQGEGIKQDNVDSCGKVKQSNEEMKTWKKNGLPCVSISTEVEKESHVSKDSGKRRGDSSAQNSNGDEAIPNSSRRFPENGVKDSSASEMPDTCLENPNKILAENKNKASFEKSRNKRLLSGLNVTKTMMMKKKKKSLLSKPGAIFEDINSGDENGTAHSDGSIPSPSDSSSSASGNSVGESDLSQDSTRNGSNDSRGRSSGGKNASKLDLSASENMTMDMILRSSKRFKKAKLIASQNEVDHKENQAIDFVPDSPI